MLATLAEVFVPIPRDSRECSSRILGIRGGVRSEGSELTLVFAALTVLMLLGGRKNRESRGIGTSTSTNEESTPTIPIYQESTTASTEESGRAPSRIPRIRDEYKKQKMNRIKQLFQNKQEHILNIYFTAGYPQKEDTVTIIKRLAAAGVDLIEVGMPYSDPLADGPTIQESGTQALRNGLTLPLLFEQLREARETVDIPLVLMGYFNQVLQYGFDRFLEDCLKAEIDGLILPDLPLYEYEQHYRKKVEAAGLSMSFLITPQTTDDRIKKVDELSDGFIYMVSSAAITGAKSGISEQQITYFERIAALDLRNPRLIGFGISDHATYTTACKYAAGAIIGSAYIKALTAGDDVATTTDQFVAMVRG